MSCQFRLHQQLRLPQQNRQQLEHRTETIVTSKNYILKIHLSPSEYLLRSTIQQVEERQSLESDPLKENTIKFA